MSQNSSALVRRETSLSRKRDDSTFNAFIDNVELLQSRKDRSRLMVDPVEASQDEEELTSREVKVISQNLDVGSRF